MLSANKERLLIAFISSSLLLLFLTLLYNLQHKVERNCDSRHFVLFLIFGIHSFLFKSYATIYSFVCLFVCFSIRLNISSFLSWTVRFLLRSPLIFLREFLFCEHLLFSCCLQNSPFFFYYK